MSMIVLLLERIVYSMANIIYHKVCKDPRCRKPFDTSSRNQAFCCPECQKRYYDERKKRRGKYATLQVENSIVSAAYRLSNLVADYYLPEHTCCVCGAESTHVHHISLNILDNRPENLVRMCEKCHKLLHSNLPSVNMIDALSSTKDSKVDLQKLIEVRLNSVDPGLMLSNFISRGDDWIKTLVHESDKSES